MRDHENLVLLLKGETKLDEGSLLFRFLGGREGVPLIEGRFGVRKECC